MVWRRRRSAVCRALKRLLAVKGAWIEWQLDDVRNAVRATDPGVHRRIRVVPRQAVAG